jgi:hypothetical protein
MKAAVSYVVSLSLAIACVPGLAQVQSPQPTPSPQPSEALPPGPNPNSRYRLEPDSLPQEGRYDVNYTWGMNLHGQKFGGAIMPDMMRWLWRDTSVSTDPNDILERAFRQPVGKTN